MPPTTMTLAITGAGGFVGSAIVRAALGAGHRVRAVLRAGSRLDVTDAHLQVHAVGLTHSPELVQALSGCDVVIHVAASLSGDYTQQYAGTVTATEQLLAAMREAGVTRLVGISSFAVYDYAVLPDGAVLDERSPVESQAQRRSVYAHVKCLQEALFLRFGATVLRPGIVYDADRLWSFALGRALGRHAWLLMGPDAPLPLVHVDDVAQAALLAATTGIAPGVVLNLVEDDPPRRFDLLRRLNASAVPRKTVVRLPWPLHRALAGLAHALLGRLRRLPGLLDPVELDVRFKALNYDNRAAKQQLKWRPARHAVDELS